MEQKILEGNINEGLLEHQLETAQLYNILLVCDKSFQHLPYADVVRTLPQVKRIFSDFISNPTYESVQAGVYAFREEKCDGIVAIGGGSAIDMAKCIKLFCRRYDQYLDQPYMDTGVHLIAVPTTAGTGSESTHFAVIYRDGKKLSVAHPSIVPNVALLDATALDTLPAYQKQCTLLDAICQSIESWWSVNAIEQSKAYSKAALSALIQNYKAYLNGDFSAAKHMMRAANLAGRAINIAQTTAPHAMSYQLTKMFQIPHGHAVAVCLPGVWRYISEHMGQSILPGGTAMLQRILEEIAHSMGCENAVTAIARFERMLKEFELAVPQMTDDQLDQLANSVNLQRLKNNPVALDSATLRLLYQEAITQLGMRG